MWRRPDNRRNSGDAYTTRVSNRGIQGFPPDPFSRKYAGRLLKANCAAQPKGCSACFVPQTHYEMQINRDFTGQGENPVFRITKKYVPLNR